MIQIVILKPTARLIHDYFYEKPDKIWYVRGCFWGPHDVAHTLRSYMRMDAFAQLVMRADIRPGSRVLLLESCSGLIAGTVAEKLAGTGTVVQLHGGSAPNAAVPWFNLSPAAKAAILPLHIKRCLAVAAGEAGKAQNGPAAASTDGSAASPAALAEQHVRQAAFDGYGGERGS